VPEKNIIRPGCFRGDMANPDSLCKVSNCEDRKDCIWTKKRTDLSPLLGSDKNRTEAASKIR